MSPTHQANGKPPTTSPGGGTALVTFELTKMRTALCDTALLMQQTPTIIQNFRTLTLPHSSTTVFEFIKTRLVSLEVTTPTGPNEQHNTISQFIKHLDNCTKCSKRKDLQDALIANRQHKKIHRVAHKKLIEALRTNLKAEKRDAMILEIEDSKRLPKLEKPFPPKDVWVSPSEEVTNKWSTYFENAKLADQRNRKRKIVTIDWEDKSQWKRIVGENESTIIRCADTGHIVCLVMRNFIQHKPTLEWANQNHEKSVRLDDPGKLVLAGFSAGMLNQGQFGWTKNLLQKNHTAAEINTMEHNIASVFGMFWNVCRKVLPEEIIADYDHYMQSNNMCRMNAGKTDNAFEGYYNIGDHTFKACEMAPPSGNFAHNYVRYTHNEYNGTRYMVALTTDRIANGTVTGGNFYIASHGILVEAAANTMTVWQPRLLHGTTLSDIDPTLVEPGFRHTGMSIAISKRLATVWHRTQDKEATEEDMVEAFENHFL